MNPLAWYKRLLFSFCNICRPHQRGPVKQFFSLGLVTLASAGVFALVQQSSTESAVFLETTTEVAVVGEPFSIDVMVDVADEINAVDLLIDYPEDQLTISGLRDGESVLNIWTEDPSAEDGVITLRGGTFRRGFTGEHRIIRLRVVADEAGRITLSPDDVTFLIGDGTGTEVADQQIVTEDLTIRAVPSDAAEAARAEDAPSDGESLRTDLTGDGRVTMADISMFLEAWGTGSAVYDFSGDGQMTFRDFSIILADYFRFR